jgi:hypothetical protein
MRFAVLAELLAVGSFFLVLAPIAALALPTLAMEIVESPPLRWSALRWVGLGVPLLALWMVLAHVTHGAALDAGARREGARPQRRRAVRFGLYACGWDLMSGPLGGMVMLVAHGLREAVEVAELALRVPSRAATAFLTGIYDVPPHRVGRARRFGILGVALLGVITVVAIALLAALL